MSNALDDLKAAYEDVKASISAGVDKIKELASGLAEAHANDDSAAIEQIAADLHAAADQMKAAANPPAPPVASN